MYCIKGTCKQQCAECKADFDNGIDHYADCEDPLNCNCENIIPCPKCGGYGFNEIGIFGQGIETCHFCEDGFVLRSEYDSIISSH